jgi:hypothetical protein
MSTLQPGLQLLNSGTTISVNINPASIIGNGKTTVITAGTSVQLASSTAIISVTIRALASNTNKIYVGSSSVSSANGFQLSPQESISLEIDNLNKVWIDADTNGEGVTYIYLD